MKMYKNNIPDLLVPQSDARSETVVLIVPMSGVNANTSDLSTQ